MVASNKPDMATQLRNALEGAALVILVVDGVDFAGTISRRLLQKINKPLFIVVNKADLLPANISPKALGDWCKSQLAEMNGKPLGIFVTSAKSGFGVEALWQAVRTELCQPAKGKEGKAASAGAAGGGAAAGGVAAGGGSAAVVLIGAKGVGKSALHSTWLAYKEQPAGTRRHRRRRGKADAAGKSGKWPTAYPVVDTPGFCDTSNVKELLCAGCAALLAPEKRIRCRTMHLWPGQAVSLGGLAVVTATAHNPSAQVILRIYMPTGIPARRIGGEKVEAMAKGEAMLPKAVCPTCREKLTRQGWEEWTVTLQQRDEVAVAGLGRLYAKHSPVTLRFLLPAGVYAIVERRQDL